MCLSQTGAFPMNDATFPRAMQCSCESLDGELKHTDYLARGGSDFRRELLERLIKDLGDGDGSIVIYSPYEKTQLNAMAKLYPDMAGDVEAIVDRLVDFEQLIKSHVAHPEFRGRSSLKVTLPALVPEYSGKYENMAVRDGQQASARFFALAKGGLDAQEEERMRQELLDYCEVRRHDSEPRICFASCAYAKTLADPAFR